MIFSLLADDDFASRKLIEDFLLENEETCVSLASRFFEKSTKIYFAKIDEKDYRVKPDNDINCKSENDMNCKNGNDLNCKFENDTKIKSENDGKSNDGKIVAVFSFSAGRQLLFQVEKNLNQEEKEILRVALGKAFDEYFSNVFSISGTSEECDVISKIAQNHLAKNPKHEVDYDLMIYGKNAVVEPVETTKNDVLCHSEQNEESQIKCCSISDFDEIFPLQKSYELEEVVFSPEDFNEKAAELVLKKNLAHGKIFALSENGKFVSKLSINARGKNCVQLGGVFTVQEFRNQGFAKKLLSSFCEQNSKRGGKIVLFVKKSNFPAISLYKSCGFKKICGYKIVYF